MSAVSWVEANPRWNQSFNSISATVLAIQSIYVWMNEMKPIELANAKYVVYCYRLRRLISRVPLQLAVAS
jgi:hypothetical protein